MDAENRRSQLLELLQHSSTPLTGSSLAKQFGVSRQVIVTDVAILRAEGHDVLATPQGYIIPSQVPAAATRTVAVKHGSDPHQIEDELNLIVDNGGRVRDVIVEHPLYGELRGLLMLKSRRDVKEYLERMQATGAEPLLVLTEGVHLHTLEADDTKTLQDIELRLKEAGFAISTD